MAEQIKKTLEFTIPADEVSKAAERAVASIQKRIRVRGFRPGKAPAELIQRHYAGDIRQEVLKELVPKYFRKRIEDEGLAVVGSPDITEIEYQVGAPLRFKAVFEVVPEIELKEYKGITVPYQDPEITEEDVNRRLEQLLEEKADYISVDPRPLVDGDYAVVSLESLAGIEGQPIKQDEVVLHLGAEDTLSAFTENLRGLSPGDQKEFDVTYPEDHGQPRLAGRTIRFRAIVKGIRRKELPELNDEFAQDLGDYVSLEELREALRKSLFLERQFLAQQEAKEKLVDKLVELHDFPVPETFIEQQIESLVERHIQGLIAEGYAPRALKVNWEKIKDSQRERAIREVKASLLLDKIADREGIYATSEEVDREVQRIARQQREPVAATRLRLEKENALGRIANRIRTEKTLNFLFEHARKVAE